MLRLANAAVYLAIAIFGLASVVAPALSALDALVSGYTFAPGLSWPLVWLALAAALVALVFDLTRRIVAGQKPGLARYAALIGVSIASYGAGSLLDPPIGLSAPDALSLLVSRTEEALNQGFSGKGAYVADPRVIEAGWPAEARDIGYFQRFARPISSRLHVVETASDPVLRAEGDVRPGDVVVAFDTAHRRFWITAFILDKSGRIAPVGDGRGRALVATAQDGRPASRLDPLFPEYPRKTVPGVAPAP